MPNANMRVCGACRRPFLPGAEGTGYVYCSRECATVAWHRQLEANKIKSRKTPEDRKCVQCGSKFQTTRPQHRFCSVDCRGRASCSA